MQRVKKYYYLKLIYVLIVFACGKAFSQSNVNDSLLGLLKVDKEDTNKVKHLISLANFIGRNNADSSIALGMQALALSKKINLEPGKVGWQKGLGAAYQSIGWNYYLNAEYDKAIEQSLKSIDIWNAMEVNATTEKDKKFIINRQIQVNINVGQFYTYLGESAKALEYYSLALKKAVVNGNKQKEGSVLTNIGLVNWHKGDYNTALSYLLKSMEISKALDDQKGVCSGLGNLGLVYGDMGNFPKALEYHYKALKMDEESKNTNGIARHMGNIGLVHWTQKKYTKALECYFKALKMDEELKNKNAIARHYGNIGLVYADLKDYPRALKYYFSALNISEELKEKANIARHLGNIGLIYLEQNNYAKALQYYYRALALDEEMKNMDDVARHLGNIGATHLKQKKYGDAEKYLLRSAVINDSMGALKQKIHTELSLSELYEQKGQFKMAKLHYNLYAAANDSIYNADKSNELNRSEMNYEFDKKEIAVKAEQDKKDAVNKAEKRKQKIILALVSGLLVLVFIFAGFILRTLRITRNQKRIMEIKTKETEEQKNIIAEKNKEVLDSIHYAKRIQTALLPTEKYLERVLAGADKK